MPRTGRTTRQRSGAGGGSSRSVQREWTGSLGIGRALDRWRIAAVRQGLNLAAFTADGPSILCGSPAPAQPLVDLSPFPLKTKRRFGRNAGPELSPAVRGLPLSNHKS